MAEIKYSPQTLALAQHLKCDPDKIPSRVEVTFYDAGSHSLDKSVTASHGVSRHITRNRAEDMSLDTGGKLRSFYGPWIAPKLDEE